MKEGFMNRENALERLQSEAAPWDLVVIGGGATGLGCALDAATRGYRVALLEQADFAKGTSSRSTKLIHGGVRYLQRGELGLVREALRERGRLLRNAPHLVRPLQFLVPCYHHWELPYYRAGLLAYDLLAAGRGVGRSRWRGAAACGALAPGLRREGLRGGVTFWDAQFDDARLAVALARSAARAGATVLNHAAVIGFTRRAGRLGGVAARDQLTGREFEVAARGVINAAGIFSDQVRALEEPGAEPRLAPSQGIHLVLPREFLLGATAILVPRTEDGRVVFCIPWEGRVLIGTTDTAVQEIALEPRPRAGEVDYLLEHAGRYLERRPRREEVLSCFAGLRPLVRTRAAETARLSREHEIRVSRGGLVTIAGGKWTTYRAMAEEAVDRAAEVAGLARRRSQTGDLRLVGGCEPGGADDALARYGDERAALAELQREEAEWAEPLAAGLPCLKAEIVWAARHEMACTVEDVLARRTRLLFLDARAAAEAAPVAARLLARELGHDAAWQAREVREFTALARRYDPRAEW